MPQISYNPLSYFCAPNAASYHYVAAHDIEQIIAYAFIRCWLSPDIFSLPYTEDDIRELRRMFLHALEYSLSEYYDGEVKVGEKCPVDWGNFDSLHFGEDYFLTWALDALYPPNFPDGPTAFCFILADSEGGDDSMWLSTDAVADREKVKAAIAKAHEMNGTRACCGELI